MIKQRDTYTYCTNCKAELELKGDAKVCPNCNKHYYFNSKPAVGALLSNKDDAILLTKRGFEPYKDWWDFPGGFVEEDETLEEAAQREIKEETNLQVSKLTYIGSFFEDYHYLNEIVSIVVAVFTGHIEDDAPIKVGDDVIDYKFLAKQDIKFNRVAFDNQRAFMEKFLGNS